MSVRHAARSGALLILALCSVAPGVAFGADWPFERGDANASGVSKDVLPAKPETLWTYRAEESGFEAAAVIAGGIVYVGDFDGTFHAVKLNDGEPAWTKKFEDTGFLSAAAVVGDRLFVTDFNGILRCLSTKDGEEIWTYDTQSEAYAAPNYYGSLDLVLLTTEGGQLLAISSKTGELAWQPYSIDAPLRCWPTVDAGRVVLAGCDGLAHAVDVRTGKEVDSIEIDGPTGSTPVILDGSLFFGTYEGSFYRFSSKPLEIQWQVRDQRVRRGVGPFAAVREDIVLYNSEGKHLFAVDPRTHEERWTFQTRSPIGGGSTIAGDTAYLGTSRGKLHAVDLKSGDETWSFEAGGKFLAAPSIADSRLVIGNEDGALYCFGDKP